MSGEGLPFSIVVRVGLIEEAAFKQTWRRGSVPGRNLDVCKRMW